MSTPVAEPGRRTPRVILTGFTTALLGDERTLREFVIGDHLRAQAVAGGENAVLYLINDSYDPLDERQLRVAVHKDEGLMGRFAPFCGRPIAEIPDPHDCHPSFSAHFADALLRRLHRLEIHPVMLDTYLAYHAGHYTPYVDRTLDDFERIQRELAAAFDDFSLRHLFRAQCPQCQCIDATRMVDVSEREVRIHCGRCDRERVEERAALRGKLGWKLDCAARWNLYRADLEVFSKNHVAELGTLGISRFMSTQFYGGTIPEVFQYGDVRIARELSTRLLDMLPPRVFKDLFTAHPKRDLEITAEAVYNHARRSQALPGVSYLDYVNKQLPHDAIRVTAESDPAAGPAERDDGPLPGGLPRSDLVAYANAFSRYFHGRDSRLGYPRAELLAATDAGITRRAWELLGHALSLRNDASLCASELKPLLRDYLRSREACPELYRFLRHLFGLDEGPNITTLLATLPQDYLSMVHVVLDCALAAARLDRPAGGAGQEGRESGAEIMLTTTGGSS